MSIPLRTVESLSAVITGNVTGQQMLNHRGRLFGSPAIEAGGRIDLGTATTAKVAVTDANGRVLHSGAAAITSDTDIASTAGAIKGPISVTVTEISNAAHTLTVYWGVKR